MSSNSASTTSGGGVFPSRELLPLDAPLKLYLEEFLFGPRGTMTDGRAPRSWEAVILLEYFLPTKRLLVGMRGSLERVLFADVVRSMGVVWRMTPGEFIFVRSGVLMAASSAPIRAGEGARRATPAKTCCDRVQGFRKPSRCSSGSSGRSMLSRTFSVELRPSGAMLFARGSKVSRSGRGKCGSEGRSDLGD